MYSRFQDYFGIKKRSGEVRTLLDALQADLNSCHEAREYSIISITIDYLTRELRLLEGVLSFRGKISKGNDITNIYTN